MTTIDIIPRYEHDRSSPEDNQFMFSYEMIIKTNIPIQFTKRKIIIREKNKDKIYQYNDILGDVPKIENSYVCRFILPCHNKYVSLRGVLTFKTDDDTLIDVDIPLTFFKA